MVDVNGAAGVVLELVCGDVVTGRSLVVDVIRVEDGLVASAELNEEPLLVVTTASVFAPGISFSFMACWLEDAVDTKTEYIAGGSNSTVILS